ncbi:MAG: PKD domain-containing protein, partial [Bacteroidales bacterium]
TFANSSTPAISTWLWDFGDISSGSDNYSTQQNPTHIYFNAGTYTVTLTVTTTDGCTGSYTHQNMIIVLPSPDASFSMHPDVGSILDPKITFIDLSTNASTWSWNFGEISSSNNTSNDQNPQHSYENAGIFTVTLVVENLYGCVDSTSNEIWIKQDFAIFFPNAFTPDGDSKNDGFRPEGAGVDINNYQLYIYDRWGGMIFKTHDFYEYWNGKVMRSDKMAEVAVYSWIVFVKDTYGKSYTFKGRVTLIK